MLPRYILDHPGPSFRHLLSISKLERGMVYAPRATKLARHVFRAKHGVCKTRKLTSFPISTQLGLDGAGSWIVRRRPVRLIEGKISQSFRFSSAARIEGSSSRALREISSMFPPIASRRASIPYKRVLTHSYSYILGLELEYLQNQLE